MTNKKLLMAISLSALLLGGCFNSETGASQRAANGEATETHAPAKHEAKAEAPKEEAKAEAPKEEAKAEAPKEEAKAEAPKEEAKAEAPKEEAKAEAPKEEAKAEAPNLSACAGCHGANFEKHAMGKSKIVKDLTKAEVEKALKGYKDGSYGGAMKGLMKGQVASFDDAKIKAIAEAVGK